MQIPDNDDLFQYDPIPVEDGEWDGWLEEQYENQYFAGDEPYIEYLEDYED
jgi:hypothetical protein